MLSINHIGQLTKFITGQGSRKVNLDEVTEKELLQLIAAKLFSIRGILVFYTWLIVISIIIGFIAVFQK